MRGCDRRLSAPRALVLLVALAASLAYTPARSVSARTLAVGSPYSWRWYKGNIHTHTLNSDGDSYPQDVARWYRDHDYQFLFLTDHNYLTDASTANGLFAVNEKFLVMEGEEITDTFAGRPVHVNGLDVFRRMDPPHGTSVANMLQRSVDTVRKAGGVPLVNHLNFQWAITPDDLSELERVSLFEVFNGHHQANNRGGGGVPGTEEVWDRMLSLGKVLYGVADDDAHVFKQPGNPDVAGPGRGWIYVRADRLAPKAIMDALERGDFYASTGVELEDYQVTADAITIAIKPELWTKYRTLFIGHGGAILKETTSLTASYSLADARTSEYVRATVIDSNGRTAWVQPVFLR